MSSNSASRQPSGMANRGHPAFLPFVYLVIGSGATVLVYSLADLLLHPTGYRWLILAGLAALTSSFSIKIPGVQSKISIGDAFYFTNLVLFGPSVGVVTAALEGFTGSLRSRSRSKRLLYGLFNLSAMALAAMAGGLVFSWLMGRGPLCFPPRVGYREIALPVIALGFLQYLLNSGLVAAVVSLETRKHIGLVWKDSFQWTSLTYLAGAALAGLVAVNTDVVDLQMIGVVVPVIAAIYYTYKIYLDKVLELNRIYLHTVESLAMAIDAKDQVAPGHVRRVQVFAGGLARAMGIRDETSLRWIEASALLHDIGKLAIPEYILNKPGKLTPSEFRKVMAHSALGGDILSSVKFPYDVSRDIRHHHEHWDGSGYPDGLKGSDIPLGSRILLIADAFDAITCDRPYRIAMSRQEAMVLLKEGAGIRYDPEMVGRFESILDSMIEEVRTIEEQPNSPERVRSAPRGAQTGEERASIRERERIVFQDIVSTQREQATLHDLAQALGSTLNLEETLPIVADMVARLVPFTTCVLYLCDQEKNTLTAEHVSGENVEAFRGFSMEIGQNLSGWVAAKNHPAVNADPVFDILPLKGILETELTNALVLPMACESLCLGVITLYGGKGIRYEEDHVRVMERVARQAARAIHNATKYEETQVDALTDPLTSLPNSRYLGLYFEKEAEKAMHSGFPLALLAMDLDRFKNVNDTFGHHVGDLILLEVAKALNKCVRVSDVVCRYGGDEFVAVLSKATPPEALSLSRRIQREVESINLEFRPGEFAQVGISIGIAVYPEDGTSLETLLQKGDMAMYEDKKGKAQKAATPRRGLELVSPMRSNKAG